MRRNINLMHAGQGCHAHKDTLLTTLCVLVCGLGVRLFFCISISLGMHACRRRLGVNDDACAKQQWQHEVMGQPHAWFVLTNIIGDSWAKWRKPKVACRQDRDVYGPGTHPAWSRRCTHAKDLIDGASHWMPLTTRRCTAHYSVQYTRGPICIGSHRYVPKDTIWPTYGAIYTVNYRITILLLLQNISYSVFLHT